MKTASKIDFSPIQSLIDKIKENLQPNSIWLFGSRAKGTNREDSDWDLLVVVPDDSSQKSLDDPYLGWNLRRETNVPADVLVCSQSDFEDGSKTYNSICFEAAHFGKLIFEQ